MNGPEIRYVLVSSHTEEGFLTFMPELVENLHKVYILKGAADEVMSRVIRDWGEFFHEKGCMVEFWVSALNPFNFDGAYVPALGRALLKGNLPEPIEPPYPGIGAEFINLGDFAHKEMDEEQIRKLAKMAFSLQQEKEAALLLLKEAGRLKKEMYRMSSINLDMLRIKEITEKLIAEMEKEYKRERHYFAGAFTKEGMMSYVEEISQKCHRRYILKGPSGSGKSTIISNLASFFKEKGYIIEYYHNGLDRESLDMIIVENLKLAVVDGKESGLVARPGDVVIDMGDVLGFYEQGDAYKYIDLARDYEEKLFMAREHLEKWSLYLKKISIMYEKVIDNNLLEERIKSLKEILVK